MRIPRGYLAFLLERLADSENRVPVAGGCAHSKVLLHDSVRLQKRAAQPPPMAEDEPSREANQPHLPLISCGIAPWQRRRLSGSFRQHADEPAQVRTFRQIVERFGGSELQEVTSLANHELAGERQPAEKLGSKRGLAQRAADHEGSCRTEVRYPKVSQLLCQEAGLKALGAPDVYPAHEDD